MCAAERGQADWAPASEQRAVAEFCRSARFKIRYGSDRRREKISFWPPIDAILRNFRVIPESFVKLFF